MRQRDRAKRGVGVNYERSDVAIVVAILVMVVLLWIGVTAL